MEEDQEETKEEIKEEFKEGTFTKKMRENPWIISTFVLGVVVIIFLFSNFSGKLTGNVISADEAGKNLLSYYEASGAEGLNVSSVEETSGLYQVNFEYQGEIVPIFITKDGKFAGSLNPLGASTTPDNTQTQTPKEVPKSDKPKVELYVFAYCPYGLQMEKAFIPVVQLLGDKIDFKIRQIGAMHGDFEKVEAERQLCIEKEYPTKYIDYVSAFAIDTAIGSCSGDAACVAPLINAIYTKLGIDKDKINSCVSANGESLFSAEEQNSGANGVSGSPTVIINGVSASLSRSPEAVKTAICSAFTTAPSECSQTLSTTQSVAGFGAGTSSGATTASC
jgi:hypothetical protein